MCVSGTSSRFSAPVTDGDLPELYAACDVFLMPSRQDGAGRRRVRNRLSRGAGLRKTDHWWTERRRQGSNRVMATPGSWSGGNDEVELAGGNSTLVAS